MFRDSTEQGSAAAVTSGLIDVLDDVLHRLGELDGMYLIDERRRDEKGDDGADVEHEEHAV